MRGLAIGITERRHAPGHRSQISSSLQAMRTTWRTQYALVIPVRRALIDLRAYNFALDAYRAILYNVTIFTSLILRFSFTAVSLWTDFFLPPIES